MGSLTNEPLSLASVITAVTALTVAFDLWHPTADQTAALLGFATVAALVIRQYVTPVALGRQRQAEGRDPFTPQADAKP